MTSRSEYGKGGEQRDEVAARRAAMELISGTGRQRRGKVEAQRDREWLTWISRFRFVTAELLGARFGVSARQARARVRRLADAGLVGLHRGHAGEPYAVVLTANGATAVGVPRRKRQPRTEYQRVHELAVVQLVMQLELATAPGTSVLTERDCRQLVAASGPRYSIDVHDDRGRRHDRWPDVVVETPTGGLAFEIELSPKIGPRLASILRGYIVSSLAEVRFLVISPKLARRITMLEAQERAAVLRGRPDALKTRIAVDAWTAATAAERQAIEALAA